MKWINRNDSTNYYEDRRGRGGNKGLEILGIGLVNIDNKDCISLKAV
ncbi:MAG: hypothetical protein PHI70_03215 [Proteiniphilum sp.]|nr:hypothetical protein [Proteiniphilum sp.]MDD3908381.1 hypothetical protein [Proteiniphilum sp.]MDD4415780.1 hypothetical protein [Proteiniphilum sp.]